MSANNYLLISKSKFTVKECDADTNDCSKIGQGKTLEDSIKIAEKYEQSVAIHGGVEYGIHFEK